jgi:hypothetical protein
VTADDRPLNVEHVPVLVECAVVGMAFTFKLSHHRMLESIVRALATVRYQLTVARRKHTDGFP